MPNNYTRLKEQASAWAKTVMRPREILMWRYPKGRLMEGWRLNDLAERTASASQLGYRVELRNADAGLEVWYVKMPDVCPYEILP